MPFGKHPPKKPAYYFQKASAFYVARHKYRPFYGKPEKTGLSYLQLLTIVLQQIQSYIMRHFFNVYP